MAEEIKLTEKKPKTTKKVVADAKDKKEMKTEISHNKNDKIEDKKVEDKSMETGVAGDNKEVKKEEKKKEAPKIAKKEEAVAKASDVHMSKKHGMYISSFIKNKSIDNAIADLEQVMKFKKIVPFKGEIPHRKGPGMMSGRYPIKAAKVFITTLKGLKGNVIANGMDLDKTKIYLSTSNWAARPARTGGRRFKRCHLIIKAKEFK